jgi:hypothetical protein
MTHTDWLWVHRYERDCSSPDCNSIDAQEQPTIENCWNPVNLRLIEFANPARERMLEHCELVHEGADADRFDAHQNDDREQRDGDEGTGEAARTHIRTE